MQVSQENNFLYEERNENFPESAPLSADKSSAIGKIIAKYRNKQLQPSEDMSIKQTQNHHHLSTVKGINYSQIYNDLRIDNSNNNPQDSRAPDRAHEQNSSLNEDDQPYLAKAPFNFQSAFEIRTQTSIRRGLPGIIVHTPKNADTSFMSRDQDPQQTHSKRTKVRQFRISEVRDKHERKPNYHELSDLSINESSHLLFDPTQGERSENTSRTNTNKRADSNKPSEDRMVEKMGDSKVLTNSRSIGVGNYRIDKKDIENVYEASQTNSPPISSVKGTPRRQDEDEPRRQHRKQRYAGHHNENPEKLQKLQKSEQQQKIDQKNRRDDSGKMQQKKKQKVYSFQQMENVHVEQKQDSQIIKQNQQQNSPAIHVTKVQEQQKIEKDQVVHYQQDELKQEAAGHHVLPSTPNREKVPVIEQLQKLNKSTQKSKYAEVEVQTEKDVSNVLEKEKHTYEPISIEVSRVASTIKPLKPNQAGSHEEQEELLENEHGTELGINFEPIADEPTENILTQLRQSQPKEEKPHDQLDKSEYISSFNVQEYSKVYNILKSIQISLKSSVLNVQEILRCIKSYLEIIAIGNLDNIDEFDLLLHKKKIIKYSLFLERVAMIVLAFSYTTQAIKQSLKYILNMVTYSINNCLILIKVLEETQIVGRGVKKSPQDSAFVKSDRLAMKRNLDSLRNNNNVLMDVIQKLSKGEELFYENLNQIVKLINKSSLEQTFYSLLEYFSFFLCVSDLDHMIPFLAVAPNPYLSPPVSPSKYTLVIDVVEIFCYGTRKSKTNVFRPYTQHFLTQMSQYFEIVSFTAMFPTQVDKIIDMLDPKGHISHRLYKHHTINASNHRLKCLDRVGRNLDEVILLDNQNEGGAQSMQNCIHVPFWKGTKNDTVLAELCPLLAMIALKKVPAPIAVGKVREQNVKNKKEGVKYINFGISLD